jgi:hypothetical protein
MIYVVTGVPGIGKSDYTSALRLLIDGRCDVVSLDNIRQTLREYDKYNDLMKYRLSIGDAEIFKQHAVELTKLAIKIALHVEHKGRNPIIDGCQFCAETFRENMSDQSTKTILLTTKSREELCKYYDSFSMNPMKREAYLGIYDFLSAAGYDEVRYLNLKAT